MPQRQRTFPSGFCRLARFYQPPLVAKFILGPPLTVSLLCLLSQEDARDDDRNAR